MADTLTITDNRTGKTYEVPVEHGTIDVMILRSIKTDPEDLRSWLSGNRQLQKHYHLYRWRPRYSQISGVSDRTACRKSQLP